MIIMAVVVVLGLAAASAWAGPWGGHWGRGGPGYGAGPESQAFLEETADLRDELAGKRGEYQALMAGQNPDPKEAARLQQEISRIREQIRIKAQSYQDSSAYNRYGDRAYGGRGGHHRGGGYCW